MTSIMSEPAPPLPWFKVGTNALRYLWYTNCLCPKLHRYLDTLQAAVHACSVRFTLWSPTKAPIPSPASVNSRVHLLCLFLYEVTKFSEPMRNKFQRHAMQSTSSPSKTAPEWAPLDLMIDRQYPCTVQPAYLFLRGSRSRDPAGRSSRHPHTNQPPSDICQLPSQKKKYPCRKSLHSANFDNNLG